MILPCSCKHKDQDDMHGKGMRLMNRCKPKTTNPSHYRCTVCGKEQTK